jgi:hypothetical protein
MVLNPVSLALRQQDILDSSQFSAAYPTEPAFNVKSLLLAHIITDFFTEIALYKRASVKNLTSTFTIP